MIKNQSRNWLTILLVGLVFPALAFSCSVFTPQSAPQLPELPQLPDIEVSTPVPPEINRVVASIDEEAALVELYTRANPAVVNITVFQKEDELVVPVGQGSGFVFDSQGNIVTNAHVVHGAEQVEVTFSSGAARSATLVGEDLNSDLAVIRVDDLPDGVAPLPLGDMESLAVGQSVVAIGNPFGLDGTLTRGVISALGRNIPALTAFSIPQSIQTDAAINPGNSGGPLMNLNGEVIGVNAQIETGGVSNSNLGIGFAIPVSIVRLVVPDLIEKGEHAWAWLGVRGGNLTPTLVKAMELPVDTGAYIAEVLTGGPSGKAGLQGADRETVVDGRQLQVGGDVITAVDGQPVNTFDDLLIYIALNTAPGQQVTLTILRNGESREIQVLLEPRPEDLQNN
jgi:2-alkenal reductase